MRKAFVEALVELATVDDRVFLLTADLGWRALEPFMNQFPQRYLNVGVAEQNLAGVATGLAQVGFIPFIYSIATFISMRCFEQLRNGAVLHQLPIRVIGIGGGYAYGHAGPTHYGLEDLALFRTQPGVTVMAPSDPEQARSCILATANLEGPVYLRIDKGPNPTVPELRGRFSFNSAEVIRGGSDILILSCGSIASEALKAAELLQHQSISAAVAILAHLSLIAGQGVVDMLRSYPLLATVEEAYLSGGLSSLVAEAIAQNGLGCRLLSCAVGEPLDCQSGSEKFMRSLQDLSSEAIASRIVGAFSSPSL
jgi:transketolase